MTDSNLKLRPHFFDESGAAWLLAILAIVAGVAASAAWRARPATNPTLYFNDVGQGDSSLIVLGTSERILIDGGPSGEMLLTALSKSIPAHDRYIDLVIMTHPQLDHFGGFIKLMEQYRVGLFIGTGRRAAGSAYAALHESIEHRRVPYLALREGAQISIGESRFSVIGPSWQDLVSKELNDSCIVLLLRAPGISALYTGDIGLKTENRLRMTYDLDVDVLKVAHHGSRFSSGDEFLAAVSPRVAVIGVGKNSYGHPTRQALGRLTAAGARVMRTDQLGTLQLRPVRTDMDFIEILQTR
jgi:competence protein ComEC